MKRLIPIICMAIAIAGASCKPKGAADDGAAGSTVVAIVGNEQITAQDLDEAARGQLQRVEARIYQIKKRVLSDLIEEKLLAGAAAKEGISVDAYAKKMIDDKVTEPTDEEIEQVYEARKGKGAPPLKDVKDQIAQYLEQNQRKHLELGLLAKLKEESNVKVFMDAPRVEVDTDDAPAIGPKDAAIMLIEFSDYQCPFCGRVRDTVWELVEKYKGKIRYVFMDYPLSFHRDAQAAAEAAHCAGDQDKYFDYNRMLFNNQGSLTLDDLKRYAQKLGLDTKKFDACMSDKKYARRVEESLKQGSAVGVSGTPAFFINGIMISGAQPIAAFSEIIDAELERKK